METNRSDASRLRNMPWRPPLELAHAANEWVLAEDAVPVFESLLALHDAQLAIVPLHKIISAERRLMWRDNLDERPHLV
ncbi:hypothetical protein OKW43_006749 [Paraburkholderia sp. WC7.3g]|uniref:hypothetical protein n=1 Tax=Paraburkholderia sp. WC7.3g TaxID=2991070 RepID=UPI003D1EAED5